MPYYEMPGFDKWCRVKAGMSNAKISAVLGITEDTLVSWRHHELVEDPAETLMPLQGALEGPWHPSVAEPYWQELMELVRAARPTDKEPTPVKSNLLPPDKPNKTKKAAVVKTDPALDALKAEIDKASAEVGQAVSLAEQLSGGWFTRSTEKFKKYLAQRDLKHRKAYLAHMLEKSQESLGKLQTRRDELAARLERLGTALGEFDAMQRDNSEKMEKKRDDNVDLWRQLKAAGPQVMTARQAWEKGKSKTLAGLDDIIKRAHTARADWQTKHDAIDQEAGVAFHWIGPDSKLAQRLAAAQWSEDQDPFEGVVICKDKLADSYKAGPAHGADKPIEIDLSSEIDLTIAGLEGRQRLARSMSK